MTGDARPPSPDAAPIRRLLGELDALDRAYSVGHHGLWVARRRADLFDVAIAELFEACEPPDGVALAALGGYGRRQQLPRSDIDLLILHDGVREADVAAFTERLLYPLWDAGFEVGHAMRTPTECGQIAHERLDAFTAMLDARAISGSAGLVETVLGDVRTVAISDPDGFIERLHSDARERAERVGSAAHLLEPDLKTGAGGLRDIHVVRWIELALGDGLEETSLRQHDREALGDAEEFLTRVRSALHLETGRRADRLPLELQPSVAREMGFADEPRLIAEDGLMRAVFEHARAVRWISDNLFARMRTRRSRTEGDDDDIAVGTMSGPEEVLAALADVAESGARPSPSLLDAIEAAGIEGEVIWNDEVREGFLRIARAGEWGVHALDALDRLGLLVLFLPAWRDVRCRPQRDPYHRYTVDAHLTGALAAMGRLLAGGDTEDPVRLDMVKLVDDIDGLLLGTLLHDIGKIGEGSHVPNGVTIAASTLERLGVAPSTREFATFMVAEHLLLPDTATRRDLGDEGLILDTAARIGSSERLAALYLLAQADALATGPAAWTSWRRTLIRELVGKVQRVFERGDMGTELASRLTERIDRLRDLLADEPEDAVERFVLRMPRGYFLAVEPATVARHFATIAPDIGANDVRTAAVVGSRAGTYELLVVAADKPGLLSWIAGSLALAGLSILTAQVFTTGEGVAVDLFVVEGIFEPDVDEPRWREFRATLRKAVQGRTSLTHRVVEKRRHYPKPARELPITVAVDNSASDFSTVIEIGALDRIGLLYDITSALADLRLDVYVAKVATYADRVVDSFYVRDSLGGKITDPQQIAEIGNAVRARSGD